MLTRRSDTSARFTRKDVPRVAIAAGILILAMTAVLGADILPEAPLDATVGQLATRDVVAPRAVDFVSESQTEAKRLAAMNEVPPQYTFTSENAIRIAADQQVAFKDRVSPIDTTFSADLSDEGRASLLETAIPDLTPTARDTLTGLDAARWAVVRLAARPAGPAPMITTRHSRPRPRMSRSAEDSSGTE